MDVFSPTRLQYSSYVDFVTICTEYRVLSLQADFRTTKERRLLMAHKLRPHTKAYNAQVSLDGVMCLVSGMVLSVPVCFLNILTRRNREAGRQI